MKFKEFIQTKPLRKPGVVITWGRFNPPTLGHETVFNEAARLANLKDYELQIHMSESQDSERNPLSHSQKVDYARLLFPRYRKYIREESLKRLDLLVEKLNKEFDNLVLIAGSDRISDFHEALQNRIPHDFVSFETWSSGDRDPDSDGVQGISATEMREYAFEGNILGFSAGLPSNTSEEIIQSLFEDVRFGMGLSKRVPVSFPRSESREQFYAGALQEGQEVETKDGVMTILRVGANHVEVLDSNSNKRRIWPSDLL